MKLSALSIWLIGLAIFIFSASYGFAQHWIPNNQEAKDLREYAEKLQTEINKAPQAKKRVEDAQAKLIAVDREWTGIVAAKTPSTSLATGGIDLNVNPLQLVNDVPKFRDNLQLAINAQMTKGGVKLLSAGPLVPFSSENPNEVLSFFNYPAMAAPCVILEYGPIRVKGTYEQIKAHVKSWKDFPKYFATTDGLQFTGTSPNLIATYNVNIVGFIRAKELWQPIPEGSVAAGGNGAAGGGGGGRPGAGGPPAGVAPGVPGPGGPPPGLGGPQRQPRQG